MVARRTGRRYAEGSLRYLTGKDGTLGMLPLRLMTLFCCVAMGAVACSSEERGPIEGETPTDVIFTGSSIIIWDAEPGESAGPQQPSEDVLTLQYQYINAQNYEQPSGRSPSRASRSSLDQYLAFFQSYSYYLLDYSILSTQVQGDTSGGLVTLTLIPSSARLCGAL
jgi:hypothetical protein